MQYDDQDFKNDEDYLRSLHYDFNRSKQEKLLLFTNILRLLVVFISGTNYLFVSVNRFLLYLMTKKGFCFDKITCFIRIHSYIISFIKIRVT